MGRDLPDRALVAYRGCSAVAPECTRGKRLYKQRCLVLTLLHTRRIDR
jgi:hypothetical protein